MEEKLTMGEAAARIGVTKNTLYLWEKKKRIPPAKRDRNNYRIFTSSDIEQIKKWKDEVREPEQVN